MPKGKDLHTHSSDVRLLSDLNQKPITPKNKSNNQTIIRQQNYSECQLPHGAARYEASNNMRQEPISHMLGMQTLATSPVGILEKVET
jgi:hypothetical protein